MRVATGTSALPIVGPEEWCRWAEVQASPANVAGQRRFGITPNQRQLGLSVVTLRRWGRPWRGHTALARQLWRTEIHEARLQAAFVAAPLELTARECEAWTKAVSSWDLCDQLCLNLWCRRPDWQERAARWRRAALPWVRRAGHVTVAVAAVHRKKVPVSVFETLIPEIAHAAGDADLYVRKGVSWALRQMAKNRPELLAAIRREALLLTQQSDAGSRWVGRAVLRDLRDR